MRQRTYSINIRVTQQEKNSIGRHAKKCGLSISEYLRQLANGHKPQTLSHIRLGGAEHGND